MRYPERIKEYRKDPRKNLKKYYSNTVLVPPKPKDTIIRTYREGYFKTTIYKNKTRRLKTIDKKHLLVYKKERNVDPVSYTHLDGYKRQLPLLCCVFRHYL